ncbi:imidazole glycerol phosphate synthase subunit HisH [Candidatus Pelagibacter ubique]|nr:imidazole glycerol phosphate synthase subunit HisH [Candidatus Pelagibacter ubique]
MKKIGIINYGAGNIGSIVNAIEHLNHKPIILDKPNKNETYSHIILPGVGNFGKLSKNLVDTGFKEFLDQNKFKGTYIFGICVGMQLLFEKSEEDKSAEGLGYLDGKIEYLKTFNNELPIPHIGFNLVNHTNTKIWNNITNEVFFYFVHSYCLKKTEDRNISGTSIYGEKFISFVEKENIFGSQFHPEKSHKNGLKLIKNFIELK